MLKNIFANVFLGIREMYAYFWVVICNFYLYIFVCIWRLKYSSFPALGICNWAGFEAQGIPSSSPQYTIQALMFLVFEDGTSELDHAFASVKFDHLSIATERSKQKFRY